MWRRRGKRNDNNMFCEFTSCKPGLGRTNGGLDENIAIRFMLNATLLRISRLTPYTKIYHYLNTAQTDT
jgi:hypothetical protein